MCAEYTFPRRGSLSGDRQPVIRIQAGELKSSGPVGEFPPAGHIGDQFFGASVDASPTQDKRDLKKRCGEPAKPDDGELLQRGTPPVS